MVHAFDSGLWVCGPIVQSLRSVPQPVAASSAEFAG